jgi:hypothetical protein
MSQSYRKQAAEIPSPDQRIELVLAAIQALYVAKGGLDVDAQIEVARLDVDNALICRRAEAARLKDNPNALREKGERPFVTVSEDRLHSRELTRLHELREFKRGQCRTQIQEALNRSRPRDLSELRQVLETAARDIDDVARMLPQDTGEADFEAMLAGSRRMANSGKLTPEESKALLAAVAQRNGAGITAVLGQLPPDLRQALEVDVGMQAA